MENSNTVAAHGEIEITGFTPYSQTPRWIARSGKSLSLGAKALYTAIMSYADNQTRLAFPGREALSADLGVSVRSVTGYIKELEEFGALHVTRGGRNKRTGNYYPNNYRLVFQDPREAEFPRRQEVEFPLTTPNLPTPNPFTSEQSSDPMLHVHSPSAPTEIKPIDALNDQDRLKARYLIIKIALHVRARGSFWDPIAQDTWQDLMDLIENRLLMGGWDPDMDLMDTWTISGTPSTPYEAGVELNKILHHLNQ